MNSADVLRAFRGSIAPAITPRRARESLPFVGDGDGPEWFRTPGEIEGLIEQIEDEAREVYSALRAQGNTRQNAAVRQRFTAWYRRWQAWKETEPSALWGTTTYSRARAFQRQLQDIARRAGAGAAVRHDRPNTESGIPWAILIGGALLVAALWAPSTTAVTRSVTR